MTNANPILAGLLGVDWIDVAFIMAPDGRILDFAGESEAFDPSGGFGGATAEATDDASTSLYMTSVTRDVYLGVLFDADVSLEDVRAQVRPRESALATAILT